MDWIMTLDNELKAYWPIHFAKETVNEFDKQFTSFVLVSMTDAYACRDFDDMSKRHDMLFLFFVCPK